MSATKNNARVGVLLLLAVVYVGFSLFQISRLSSEVSEYKAKTIADIQSGAQRSPNSLDTIKAEIIEKLPEHHAAKDIILASMRYVHENSIHSIDDEYEKYAFNLPVVLDKLILSSKGNASETPHLSCGPRSYAMRAILGHFNIYSRLIQIYSDSFDTVQAHRMLEVFNPDSQNWELWDPDYGVTYVDRETKEPTDIMSLVFSDKDHFMPVGVSYEGWEDTKSTSLKEHYFKSVLFEQDRGMTNSVLIINQSIFDITKTFEAGLTFSEWAQHHYSNPRIILLPMPPPES